MSKKKRKVTVEDFRVAGARLEGDMGRHEYLPIDEHYLKAWNKFIKITPLEIYDILSKDLPLGLDEKLRTSLSISDSGMAFLKYHTGHEQCSSFVGCRYFNLKKGVVSHQRMDIDKDMQGKGIAKVFLRNSMVLYERLGVKKIKIQAAKTGSYAWAKFGFLPEQSYWDRLSRDAWKEVQRMPNLPHKEYKVLEKILKSDDVRAIWMLSDLTYKINGLSLGKFFLMQKAWDGSLDLKNKEQMARFEAYVSPVEKNLEKSADLKKGASPSATKSL